jgi:hypothetical protein
MLMLSRVTGDGQRLRLYAPPGGGRVEGHGVRAEKALVASVAPAPLLRDPGPSRRWHSPRAGLSVDGAPLVRAPDPCGFQDVRSRMDPALYPEVAHGPIDRRPHPHPIPCGSR